MKTTQYEEGYGVATVVYTNYRAEAAAMHQFAKEGYRKPRPKKIANPVCRSQDGIAFEDWKTAIAYSEKHDKPLLVKGKVVYPPVRPSASRPKAIVGQNGRPRGYVRVPNKTSVHLYTFAKGSRY